MTYNLGKSKPVAKPAPAKVSRRVGLQGILSLGLIAGTAGLVGWRKRDEIMDMVPDFMPRPSDDKASRPAVMFVIDNNDDITNGQGQVNNSMIVRDLCDRLGVEYRRYNWDADLFQETSFIREMHSIGNKYGPSCMVTIGRDGRGSCQDIPKDVPTAVKLIDRMYNVSK